MKVQRRLKEILSEAENLFVEHDKRDYVIVRNGRVMEFSRK